MDHLTIDEIIDFVSLDRLNRESVELSAAVNGHIRRCKKCLKLVRAFQMIYDEFERLNMSGDLKKYISENNLIETIKNESISGSDISDDEPDSSR